MPRLVSVIMAAYNASGFIRDSISSVLAQSYPHWELLVINDGSTDDTGAVVQEFHDSRIRYLEIPHAGVSAARNKGLIEMKGDYFCFLDADDRLPENSLEIRADYLDAHPEIDMLDGWVMVMDANMQEVHRLYGPHYYGKVARFFIRISEEHFFGLIMMIRNRGQAYRFKEGMSHVEDLWFYTKLAWMENLNYGTVDDVVYHCRKSPGTASTNLDGLERGYWEFYRNVKALPGVRSQELRYLKHRISRIMTLSFLRAGRYYRAFRASLNYFFPKR